jgi:hypothetical protein
MASAVYFRQKAEQCRRLAATILVGNDPTAASLKALAVEFDCRAAALEAETAAAVMIGYGDDIGDRVPESKQDGQGSERPKN